MQLTTKARYAVMAMVDIAVLEKEFGGKPVKLSQVAERQGIALNYLEQIFAKLKKCGIVSAVKGPGGGYQIANGANSTRILDIIEAVEESLKMTACSPTSNICSPDRAKCITHDLWKGLTLNIKDYLGSKTLEDVVGKK
ncbi:MAG: Rrf2 family transcriptional regulator [Alphaproteobacteria bacterium CG11_big_fil_rev_8_21_14_0_20_44_7]|nr:MAG: Rrf2 family transcriptional regulator [Alphaproteobacteria bacterium CG11_big_fil_rev_8_21_14_0_20_44_7]